MEIREYIACEVVHTCVQHFRIGSTGPAKRLALRSFPRRADISFQISETIRVGVETLVYPNPNHAVQIGVTRLLTTGPMIGSSSGY